MIPVFLETTIIFVFILFSDKVAVSAGRSCETLYKSLAFSWSPLTITYDYVELASSPFSQFPSPVQDMLLKKRVLSRKTSSLNPDISTSSSSSTASESGPGPGQQHFFVSEEVVSVYPSSTEGYAAKFAGSRWDTEIMQPFLAFWQKALRVRRFDGVSQKLYPNFQTDSAAQTLRQKAVLSQTATDQEWEDADRVSDGTTVIGAPVPDSDFHLFITFELECSGKKSAFHFNAGKDQCGRPVYGHLGVCTRFLPEYTPNAGLKSRNPSAVSYRDASTNYEPMSKLSSSDDEYYLNYLETIDLDLLGSSSSFERGRVLASLHAEMFHLLGMKRSHWLNWRNSTTGAETVDKETNVYTYSCRDDSQIDQPGSGPDIKTFYRNLFRDSTVSMTDQVLGISSTYNGLPADSCHCPTEVYAPSASNLQNCVFFRKGHFRSAAKCVIVMKSPAVLNLGCSF